ncbi:MAG: beta-lactamase family protein [Bacteroidales bacterium]|nr:beta-lactamase family protein [Bacteroidales bacterium]
MKKRISLILSAILILALGGGLYYIHLFTPVITGYAAKNLASDVFVGNRTQESVESTDLNFSFIKFAKNTVDYNKKEVTSRFLWAKSKAIYIDGFGCVLVRGNEAEIRNRPYTIVPLPDINPDTVAWPAGDKLADTISVDIDQIKLNKAIMNAFKDSVGTKGTFAIAIAYKNQLIAEKYREGFSDKNRFLSWSMAKSFTHALVGIMVKKGLMDIKQPADIPVWKNDKRAAITIENLMHMNAGLEWNENYGNLSDVTLMLHKAVDMAEFTYNKSPVARPDSVWLYNSGATNIVSYLIRKKIGNDAEYYAFPRRELFNPIGMRSAIFETDASGTLAGSSYIYASMRDYVRFGLLYLNKGNWLGQQILPEGWTDYAMQPANGSDGQYGSSFWLNQSGDYPDVPKDLFMCRGHDGQYIYIIPSLELVVVRTGFSKKEDFNYQQFLLSIVESLTSKDDKIFDKNKELYLDIGKMESR